MRASCINLSILFLFITSTGYGGSMKDIRRVMSNSGSVADSTRSEYLDELAALNKMGIQLALLARGRPVRQELKMLANKSLDYHRKVDLELRQLAQSKQLAFQDEMMDDDKDAIGKLFKLKGTLFERSFLHMTAENQRKLLTLYRKAQEKTNDQELIKLSAMATPELETHNAAVRLLKTTVK